LVILLVFFTTPSFLPISHIKLLRDDSTEYPVNMQMIKLTEGKECPLAGLTLVISGLHSSSCLHLG
jgi:hypothetical protein